MTYSLIDVQPHEAHVEITLSRPEKRNSLTIELIEELIATLEAVQKSETVGVILAAQGTVFCAGHDYDDMLARDLAGMRQLMQRCSQLMRLIHQIPQTVIASVQGLAVGAGCQLALTCDMVVASERALFRTPGGVTGWFCFTPMVAVARAVGRKRALEMLLTGEPIGAELAAEWGLINRVVASERLLEETRGLMARITRGNRLMLGLGKQAYYAQIDLDEAQAYAYAAEVMASTGMMPGPQAKMQAFVSKRPLPIHNENL